MRRSTRAAAALAALTLFCTPASALVQPPAGSVLPDYDIRYDRTSGATPGFDDSEVAAAAVPALAVVREPSRLQRARVNILRITRAWNLVIEWNRENALPKYMHAFGQPLSAPSEADPVAVARGFLRDQSLLFGISDSEIDALIVGRNARTADLFTSVWLAQVVNGIVVDHSAIRFNIDSQGRVLYVAVGTGLQPGLEVPPVAMLSPVEAVLRAAEHIGVKLHTVPARKSAAGERVVIFERGPFLSDIQVEPTIFAFPNGQGILAWRVTLEPAQDTAAWYAVTVDHRAGRLLQRINLYDYATNEGRVFNGNYPTQTAPTHPDGVDQTDESFGYRYQSTHGWTIPAPYGWTDPNIGPVDYTMTVGNNVEAKDDRLGDNEASIAVIPNGGPNQEWFFTFTNAYALSAGTTDAARIADGLLDIDAVITNLFYWNNRWHDRMWELGFDEAYGNFQMDNMSRGACGRDSVRADGQDRADPATGGIALNNANFGTPPEPIDCQGNYRPRMQQFMTRFGPEDAPVWLADTALDADVIIHESSHGTSHRLVGGFEFGCLNEWQSGGMGEGWGDWYAGSNFDDPVMGQYSFADPVAGVRFFPMDQNPRTFADVCDQGGCQVHKEGEVWASTLWDMREAIIAQLGGDRVAGGDIAEQLVTDGMKFSICDPGFLDMRDAILMGDQVRYGGTYRCSIWSAFLGRGMGYDAFSRNRAEDNVPDFVFSHPQCSGEAHPRYDSHTTSDVAGGNGDGLYAAGETIDLDVVLENFQALVDATSVTVTVSTTTTGITMTTPTVVYPLVPAGGAAGAPTPFQFLVGSDYVCGSDIDFHVDISWSTFNRGDDFTSPGNSIDGTVLFTDDGEGTPAPLAAPFTVSTNQNHTAGGANSYYTLGGCYAADETTCDGSNPCNDTCAALTLPAVQVPPSQGVKIRFWATYNVEFNWDGPYVAASADGGVTWNLVDTFNYTGDIPSQANGCNPPVDYRGINGPADQAGLVPWTLFEGDLSAYAGSTVQLEIRNHQDACVVFEGAYLDDFEVLYQNCQTGGFVNLFISNKANDDAVDAACTDNDAVPDPGETVDVTLTFANSGTQTATGVTATLTSTSPSITVLSGPVALGDIAPGASATGVFSYLVGTTGVGCFEDTPFDVQLVGTGYNQTVAYSEVVRMDSTTATWFDDFDGAQAAWIASLGPDGSADDWAIRTLNCLAGIGQFWSTNRGMDPTVCSTGEPDYSDDSDSLLTSPPIDLGGAGMKLMSVSWAPLAGNVSHTVEAPGFMEILVDHDGDGVFTSLWKAESGFGQSNRFNIDIPNNPSGSPILPADTVQTIQFQFRFRSFAPDPGPTGGSVGLVVNDFLVEWQRCDLLSCAPGIAPGGQATTPGAQTGTGVDTGMSRTSGMGGLRSVSR